MIRRVIALLALLIITPASAESRLPDSAVVSATIAALEARDLAELDWLVSDAGELQFPRIEANTRAEATKKLLGCKSRELNRVALGPFDYFEFEWKCRKQTYVGKLIPIPNGKAVWLVDLVNRVQYTELTRTMPRVFLPPLPIVAPPKPRPLSASEQAARDGQRADEMALKLQRAELFAQAVAQGDMSAFQTRHATVGKITYGFFDPYAEVDYIDRTWRIGDSLQDAGKALSAAVAYSRSQLGPPTGWTCQDAYPYVNCIWDYAEPGVRLKAKIFVFRADTDTWGVKVFEFRYETSAKLLEAKRRAERAAEAQP